MLNDINNRLRRRNEAMERMAQDLAWLIRQHAGSLRWTGTQRDLVEMIHLVWRLQTLTDHQGRPYRQSQLARLAFAAIGRPVPKAFTRIVCDTEIRLDPNLSMLTRYERMAHKPDILQHFIRQLEQSPLPTNT